MIKLLLSLMGIALIACQGEEAIETPTQSADGNFGTRGALTTLCHWDAVTQEFEVISVNENSVQPHLNHGDQLVDADGDGYTAIGSCTGSMDDCDDLDPNVNPEQGCSETVFVIAYSNLNGEDGYQEGSADVLISKLIDFNNDGVVSAGDKVITHQYPTNFIPNNFADFTVTEHVVDGSNIYISTTEIWVSSNQINNFQWIQSSGFEFYGEIVSTKKSNFWDEFQYDETDLIEVDSGSPSLPSQSIIYLTQPSYGDDTFVDVDKFL